MQLGAKFCRCAALHHLATSTGVPLPAAHPLRLLTCLLSCPTLLQLKWVAGPLSYVTAVAIGVCAYHTAAEVRAAVGGWVPCCCSRSGGCLEALADLH